MGKRAMSDHSASPGFLTSGEVAESQGKSEDQEKSGNLKVVKLFDINPNDSESSKMLA